MDLAQHRIKKYANGVSKRPDYLSDAGYAANQLRDGFGFQRDNEIEEKHNALIDEQEETFAGLESHTQNSENPYRVTKDQTGLDKADNTPDDRKRVEHTSLAIQNELV